MNANKVAKAVLATFVAAAMVVTVGFPRLTSADETTYQETNPLANSDEREVDALVEEIAEDAGASDQAALEDSSAEEAASDMTAQNAAEGATEEAEGDAAEGDRSAEESDAEDELSVASLDEDAQDAEVVDPVAKIGDEGFETLDDAISAAAEGDTIALQKDATITKFNANNKTFTLDLGAHTLTNSGTMTFNGNTTICNGTLNSTVASSYCGTIYDGKTLTLAGDVNVTSKSTKGVFYVWGGTLNTAANITWQVNASSASLIYAAGGNVNVSGGKIYNYLGMSAVTLFKDSDGTVSNFTMTGGTIESFAYTCVMTNGAQSGTSSATITGGTIETTYGNAIVWPSEGVLTIGGAAGGPSISGASGIVFFDGTLTINSGTIAATNSGTYFDTTDTVLAAFGNKTPIDWFATVQSGTIGLGDAVLVVAHRGEGYVDAPLAVAINGGAMSAIDGNGFRYIDCNESSSRASGGSVAQAVSVSLAGGTFSSSGAGSAVEAKTVVNESHKFISGGTYTAKGAADTSVASYLVTGRELNGAGTVVEMDKQSPEGGVTVDPDSDVTLDEASEQALANTATSVAAAIQTEDAVDASTNTVAGVQVAESDVEALAEVVEAASVYDEVTVTLEVTAEEASTPEEVTGAKAEGETATTFDISVAMKVTVVSASDGTETSATAQVVALPETIRCELEVPSSLVKDKNVRIAHLHEGEIEYITEIEVSYSADGATATLAFETSKFSTFTVLTSEVEATKGDPANGDGNTTGEITTHNTGDQHTLASTGSDTPSSKTNLAKTGDVSSAVELALLGAALFLLMGGATLVHRLRQD